MKFLSYGEILWDIFPDKKCLGGAPLNFAAHLAKHREESYLLSAVGDDELGKAALEQIRKWGISLKYVAVSEEKETGVCMVSFDEDGTPSYDILRDKAYDYIDFDVLEEEFSVLSFGTMALRNEYSFNSLKRLVANNNFDEIFVDVNIRPPFYSKKTVDFSIENATILKISLEELPKVCEIIGLNFSSDYKSCAKELIRKYSNLKLIIITLGSDGAYALLKENLKEFSCECVDVKVASFVGAGDSFSASFLHKYLRGNDIQSSLDYASKVAGFVVSEYGAVPDYSIEDF